LPIQLRTALNADLTGAREQFISSISWTNNPTLRCRELSLRARSIYTLPPGQRFDAQPARWSSIILCQEFVNVCD